MVDAIDFMLAKNVIIDTLTELEPTLDMALDNRIFNICFVDFMNYMIFLGKFGCKVGDESKYDPPEIDEIRKFVSVWAHLWWKKYKQRFKLTFEVKQNPIAAEGEKMLILFTAEERAKIKKIAVMTLIRYGEISGSDILAESIFNTTLGKMPKKKVLTLSDKLEFANNVIKACKNIAGLTGPLIFIKINNSYLQYSTKKGPQPL